MGIPSNFTEKNIEFGSFSVPAFYQAFFLYIQEFQNQLHLSTCHENWIQ